MTISTKIYIDGGDPQETKKASEILKAAGFGGLDGQTTNPSLIAKNALKSLQEKGGDKDKLSSDEAFDFYKQTVQEMRKYTDGPISIQMIGDPETLTADEMLTQARDRNTWIPNAAIKFPCTKEGLQAAEEFCQEGMVNITLNFSQEQAAAVYVATKRADHEIFISPFVGRLDDRGENGMDVVVAELEMYRGLGDGHVNVLTASIRNIEHVYYALFLKSDVMTIPFKVFTEWADGGFQMPPDDYVYDLPDHTEIPYRELSLDTEWKEFDLHHDLTDAGITKFWEDWSKVVE